MQQPPSQGAGGVGDELRSDVQQVGTTAANRLQSEVDARKSTAANQAKSVSSAIQRAAGELDDSAPTWLKSAFEQGAERIQRFADTIDQKDSRQLLGDVQNFARNNPGTFLAACAAAGFAAARIFKAGAEPQSSGAQWSTEQDSAPFPVQVDNDSAMFRSSTSDAGTDPTPRREFV
jgi:hypothetical protein